MHKLSQGFNGGNLVRQNRSCSMAYGADEVKEVFRKFPERFLEASGEFQGFASGDFRSLLRALWQVSVAFQQY